MKKIILFFAVVLAMYSCSNDETFYPIETQQAQSSPIEPVPVNIYAKKGASNFYWLHIDILSSLETETLKDDIIFEEIILSGLIHDISFMKHNDILNGEAEKQNSTWYIQNVGDDFTIPKGTPLPHKISIIVAPNTYKDVQKFRLMDTKATIKYTGGKIDFLIYTGDNYKHFFTPNDEYTFHLNCDYITL